MKISIVAFFFSIFIYTFAHGQYFEPYLSDLRYTSSLPDKAMHVVDSIFPKRKETRFYLDTARKRMMACFLNDDRMIEATFSFYNGTYQCFDKYYLNDVSKDVSALAKHEFDSAYPNASYVFWYKELYGKDEDSNNTKVVFFYNATDGFDKYNIIEYNPDGKIVSMDLTPTDSIAVKKVKSFMLRRYKMVIDYQDKASGNYHELRIVLDKKGNEVYQVNIYSWYVCHVAWAEGKWKYCQFDMRGNFIRKYTEKLNTRK